MQKQRFYIHKICSWNILLLLEIWRRIKSPVAQIILGWEKKHSDIPITIRELNFVAIQTSFYNLPSFTQVLHGNKLNRWNSSFTIPSWIWKQYSFVLAWIPSRTSTQYFGLQIPTRRLHSKLPFSCCWPSLHVPLGVFPQAFGQRKHELYPLV